MTETNSFESFGDELIFEALELVPTDDEIKEFDKTFWSDTYPIVDEYPTRGALHRAYWKLEKFVRANRLNFTGYSESAGVPPGPGESSAGTMSGDIPCVTIFKFPEVSVQIANRFALELNGGQSTVEQSLNQVVSFTTPCKFPEIFIGTGDAVGFEFASEQKFIVVGDYTGFAPEKFHTEICKQIETNWVIELQRIAPGASLLLAGNRAHVYFPDKFRAAEKTAWLEVIAVIKNLGPLISVLDIPDPEGTKLTFSKLRTPFRVVRALVLFASSVAIFLLYKWFVSGMPTFK